MTGDHHYSEPSPLDYNATLKRMEDGIAPMDPGIALASIAISLKDISVTLTAMYDVMIAKKISGMKTVEDIHTAISGLTGTPGAINNMGMQIATELRILQNIIREKQ